MTLHSVERADQVQDARVSRSGRLATDQKAVRRRGPGRVVLGSKPQLATAKKLVSWAEKLPQVRGTDSLRPNMGEEGVDGVDRITAGRLAKLGRLEEAGVRAFPTTFSRSHRAQEIHADFDALNGQRVCVAGRLDVFRKLSSNLVFVDVKDESGRIQLMLHPRGMDDAQRLVYEALDPGDFVGACGP